MGKKLNFLLIITSALLFLECLFLCYNAGKKQTKQALTTISQSGKIQVKVLEANTFEPIDNATVCIIETRHYETTNKFGKTSFMNVPILRNNNFDISLFRNWGELTILVYKNGYTDNISFYNSIIPNTTRLDFVVYLSPITNAEDLSPNISVEKPNINYVNRLIQLYKKEYKTY